MAIKRIRNNRQYEAAISKFVELQLQDTGATGEELKRVATEIDEYEARVWRDNPFEIFDFLR